MPALRQKPDGRYFADYYDTAGKRHRPDLGRDESMAQAAFAELCAALQAQASPNHALTLSALFDWCLTTRLAENGSATRAKYRARGNHFTAWAQTQDVRFATDLSSQLMSLYYASLIHAGCKVNTARVAIGHLKAMIRAAVRADLLERDPVKIWPPCSVKPTEIEVYKPGEIAALLESIHRHRPRLHPLMLFLCSTALSIGDVVHLRHERIDLDTGIVHLRRRKTGTPIYKHLNAQALDALRRAGTRGPGLVFPCRPGVPWHPSEVLRRIKSAAEKDGLPFKVGLHKIRHSAATVLLANGATVKDVQAMLGHASVTTTLTRYAQFVPNADRTTTDTWGSILAGAQTEGTTQAPPNIQPFPANDLP